MATPWLHPTMLHERFGRLRHLYTSSPGRCRWPSHHGPDQFPEADNCAGRCGFYVLNVDRRW